MTATYATTSDVQARIPYRTISTTSKPTTAQVQDWLDSGQSMLDGALLAAELPAPYTSDHAKAILKMHLVSYVEGRVRQAYASAGGDGNNDDGRDLIEAFEGGPNRPGLIEKIAANPVLYGSMLAAGSSPDSARRLSGHVLDNADGLTISEGDFAPTFTVSEKL
ncbi:MAG: hypothetical protein RL139_899 [Gemmatimonadota bacterium]|jgi:hypothetical protein